MSELCQFLMMNINKSLFYFYEQIICFLLSPQTNAGILP